MAIKGSSRGAEAPGLSQSEILELLEKVSKLGLEEVTLEKGGVSLHIVGRRAPEPQATIVQAAAPVAAPANPTPLPVAPAAAAPAAPPAAPAEDPNLAKITSPMIGTFYRSPAPESPSFVKVGDRVDENTVLCIIEAMKLMNEIKAERSGVIRQVLVENGQPVEYGQPMFLIEPA